MNRHVFLAGLHELLQPRSYLEIGIRSGRGLAQSHTRTIGVDPEFNLTVPFACDVQVVKATSDDFFSGADPVAHFPEAVVDLAFVDGMHLFEYALRDFMNVERFSTPGTVVMIDDMLPRHVDEASRDRETVAWAGDVFKVGTVLEKYRPDLTVVWIDTEPTGMMMVVGLKPGDTTLSEHYDQIVADNVLPDPQLVPTEILHRSQAADPERVLASEVWADLVTARASGLVADSVVDQLCKLRGTAMFTPRSPDAPPPRRLTGPAPGLAPPKGSGAAGGGAGRRRGDRTGPARQRGLIHRLRKAIKRRL